MSSENESIDNENKLNTEAVRKLYTILSAKIIPEFPTTNHCPLCCQQLKVIPLALILDKGTCEEIETNLGTMESKVLMDLCEQQATEGREVLFICPDCHGYAFQ